MSPKAFVIHKHETGFEVLFSFRGRNAGHGMKYANTSSKNLEF